MNTFECCVAVSSDDLYYYQKILDEGLDFFKENDEEFPIDVTLFSITGTFENGWSAKYEVFTGDESVMSSCYLYNANGEEVAYEENDCSIASTTEFNINEEETYIFVIHEEDSIPVYVLK